MLIKGTSEGKGRGLGSKRGNKADWKSPDVTSKPIDVAQEVWDAIDWNDYKVDKTKHVIGKNTYYTYDSKKEKS